MSGDKVDASARARALHRAVVVLLDVRKRWWLSPWLWGALTVAAAVFSSTDLDMGSSMSGRTTSVPIYQTGDQVHLVQTDRSRYAGAILMSNGYSIGSREWSMEFNVGVTWIGSGDAPTEAEMWALVSGLEPPRHDAPSGFSEGRRRSIQRWMDTTFARMVAHGERVVVETPPLRVVAMVWAGRLTTIVCGSMFAASFVSWIFRGIQVGAYARMVKRLDEGRCPVCAYDISAHPVGRCPECGCDHHARGVEAQAAIERARA